MLEEILAHKRAELAERRRRLSYESLLGRARATTRDFEHSLRSRRPGFILEVKTASPSAGALRPESELEPVLAAYAAHADAISVLTDEHFFGGSLARLRAVRRRVRQPLLCKDFILDPYQVAEARGAGADAVLLILAALSDAQWRDCAALACRLGMAVLTEVHDAAEAARAVALGARVIGINNRDLRTLAVDPGTVARLAPRLPPRVLVVAESGIATREDAERQARQADAMLIGSAVMRSSAPSRTVRRLVFGRTKICGLTSPDDAMAAAAAGATHGGLVFVPSSPRRVEPEAARAIAESADLDWVGVFADASPALMASLARSLNLAAVQLHGREDARAVAAVRAALPPSCRIWQAARVAGCLPAGPAPAVDRLLFDTWVPGRAGGTGRSFDWSLLDGYPARAEVVLAGGIHPGNVERAAALGVHALDVSTGVERSMGRKDAALMAVLLERRRRLPGRRA